MALPSSGAISLADVNVELGVASTTTRSLNDSAVRTLFGVASGAIDMATGRGKSNRVAISYTFASNTANASLNLSALGGYNAGKSDITVTINSGVYLYATSTANYGLNITGGTSGDTLTIVNNGYIMGQGGKGGSRKGRSGNVSAAGGGPALNFGFALSGATVTNTSGYIGGGGGGGAWADYYGGGGGGAGGGAGGDGEDNNSAYATGGSGGGVGSTGGNGSVQSSIDPSYGGPASTCTSGGGGGRIMPGTGGGYGQASYGQYGLGGGAGGGGSTAANNGPGSGGSAGNAGGSTNNGASGGGGGWGASGGSASGNSPGSGGKAVNLNAKSITWTGGTSSSSRAYGAVS